MILLDEGAVQAEGQEEKDNEVVEVLSFHHNAKKQDEDEPASRGDDSHRQQLLG